jgi:hypothetical protein
MSVVQADHVFLDLLGDRTEGKLQAIVDIGRGGVLTIVGTGWEEAKGVAVGQVIAYGKHLDAVGLHAGADREQVVFTVRCRAPISGPQLACSG